MLTPEQIDAIRDKTELITEPVQRFLIADIIRRIMSAGKLTATAKNQAEIARMLGDNDRKVKRYLEREKARENAEFAAIFEALAKLIYDNNSKLSGVGIEKSETLQNIVNTAVLLAQDDFSNIVQTLGFVDPWNNAQPLTKAYQSCCDYALKKTATGAQSYTDAVREAVKNISKYGVQVIDYESGQHASLDVAVRRNIFGGMGLMVEQVEEQAHEDMGANGWEISAHEASAKDHEPYQGKQYTDAEYMALNGTPEEPGKLKRRISTLNCKHIAFPIVLGISKPQYTNEELEAMKSRNEEGVTIDGRHYTMYEATQKQREIERRIRKQRRKVLALDEMGDEFAGELQGAKIKQKVLESEYKRFSEAAKLRTQQQRIEVLGFGPEQR